MTTNPKSKPGIAETLARSMRLAARRAATKQKPPEYPGETPEKREAPRPDRPHPHMVKRAWRDSTSGD